MPSRTSRLGQLRPRLRGMLALAPFAIYVALFLVVPTIAVVVGAFQTPAGRFTLSNIAVAAHAPYSNGFVESLELALVTSVVPGILGVFVAYAVHTSRRRLLRRVVFTASGVFANFGGVPLAFLFIATLSATGVATVWLKDLSISLTSRWLFTFPGVALVYMYFQVPLMVLIVTPALNGLRPAWREASENLGARSRQYWRCVGAPVLAPTVLGCTLLLFGFGLSAYATARALTAGTIPLTPIQIGDVMNGNVIAGQQNVGMALGLGLIVVMAIVLVLYTLLQRRASRWLSQ
ncbi:MAG: ABC transporter permease subunit [Actinomycetota bacterium]|jgi:putative spermidine/putrescine transport system permease protein|nr:ABC transporter permease subunit [Actinomycetota bacterium]